MRLANPEAFLLLPLAALALGWSLRSRHHGAVRFSALRVAGALPTGWAVSGPALLFALRAAGLVLLTVALARPQSAGRHEHTHADGIAIQLVIDNSYSMRTRDYDLGPRSISRLDAVKHAVRLFVEGGQGLRGRPDDRVGIITFARDPDVVCPVTLDHAALLQALDHIDIAPPVGTNIGDALAWGLDRLRQDPSRQKVIVLLSDGANTVKDSMPPLEAAQLAADLGIKVYTVGAVGNRFNRRGGPLADLFHRARQRTGGAVAVDEVDEEMMQEIAARTGGQYFRATDTRGLAAIYQEIDRLETTRVDRTVHTTYREWFLPLTAVAVGLLALEQLLAATRLLRVP